MLADPTITRGGGLSSMSFCEITMIPTNAETRCCSPRQRKEVKCFEKFKIYIDLAFWVKVLHFPFDFSPRLPTWPSKLFLADIALANLGCMCRALSTMDPTLPSAAHYIVACASAYWEFPAALSPLCRLYFFTSLFPLFSGKSLRDILLHISRDQC